MKIYKKILCVFMLTLFGCTERVAKSETKYEEETPVIEHSYSEVSDYELSWDSTFDVDESKYYVYFYSSTCSHCGELKNYIIEKALKNRDIYFVKGSSKDQLTNDTKKLIGAEKPEDIWILGYPSLLKIYNRKVTKNLAGTAQIKDELK